VIILSENRAKVKRFKIKLFHSISVREYADTPENNKLVSKLKKQYGEDNVKKVEVEE